MSPSATPRLPHAPSHPIQRPSDDTTAPAPGRPITLSAAERELVRASWAVARRDAGRFRAALHEAIERRLPAVVALAGDAAAHAAALDRLVHTVDVAVRHLERLLGAAHGVAAPRNGLDPIGVALLDAIAACHAPGVFPAAARAAWRRTWTVTCALLRPLPLPQQGADAGVARTAPRATSHAA